MPDARNDARQAFCSHPDCQRQRRTESQRHRRSLQRKEVALTRRLNPSEAAWLKQNPLVIGLISVLIDSIDLAEIETYCSTLIARGMSILNSDRLQDSSREATSKDLRSV